MISAVIYEDGVPKGVSSVVEIQALPAPNGELRPGSTAADRRRRKWLVRKILHFDGRTLAFVTRPRGAVIHIVALVETPRGWVMAGIPTPL